MKIKIFVGLCVTLLSCEMVVFVSCLQAAVPAEIPSLQELKQMRDRIFDQLEPVKAVEVYQEAGKRQLAMTMSSEVELVAKLNSLAAADVVSRLAVVLNLIEQAEKKEAREAGLQRRPLPVIPQKKIVPQKEVAPLTMPTVKELEAIKANILRKMSPQEKLKAIQKASKAADDYLLMSRGGVDPIVNVRSQSPTLDNVEILLRAARGEEARKEGEQLQQHPKEAPVAGPSQQPSVTLPAARQVAQGAGIEYTHALMRDLGLLSENRLPAKAVIDRIDECLAVLSKEDAPVEAKVMPKGSRVFVIGDIHCSLDVFRGQLGRMRELGAFESPNSLKLRPNVYLVFTGDYADRGVQGTEVFMYVMALKRLNPTNVFMGRGNHETSETAKNYGFFGVSLVRQLMQHSELEQRFGAATDSLINKFNELFLKLPVVVFLGIEDAQHVVRFGMYNHAGFDRDADRAIKVALRNAIERKGTIHSVASGIPEISSLLWGDYLPGVGECGPSPRGAGLACYKNTLNDYLQALEAGSNFTIDFQARGHQHLAPSVLKLVPEVRENSGFMHVDAPLTIDKKEIFLFMSIGLTNYWVNFAKTYSSGLGEFNMNELGKWVLTPHTIAQPVQ